MRRTGSKADLGAIDAVRDAHIAALNRGDASSWSEQFTDDATQMPPNAPENVGRSSIATWSQAFLDAFHVTFTLAVKEVHAAGQWAFETGGYRIRLAAKAGGPEIEDVGKYITIYEKDSDGAWRMARDIWNSDHPLTRA